MAHPYAQHREVHAGRKRAHAMAKHFKRGGEVHSDEAQDRKLFSKMLKEHDSKVHGHKAKGRLDKRPRRAEGGRLPKETVKPLEITSPSEGSADKNEWMQGLSDKEKASILGSTTRDPKTGMRGHKKGGAVGKFARGGRAKHKAHTKINILVAPKGGDASSAPAPGGLPPGLPPGGGPPRPPMMPPGAGGPPGMPPGMPPRPPGMMNRGGKVGMKAGADSGEGRLQKKKAYGLSPRKGS